MQNRNKDNLRTILYGAAGFLGCAIIYLLLIASCIWQSHYGVESETAIEWVQDIVLGATAVVFYLLAAKIPQERGGLLLIAGFMTCLFIREQDAYFDLISHGFWKYVMIAYLVVLFGYIWRRGIPEALEGVAEFVRSKAFITMLAGVGMLLVYSRLYGSDKFVWSLFIEEPHWRYIAKRLSEESMELMSYALMLISACSYYAARLCGPKKH